MLDIDQIKKYYTSDIYKFDRGILREYLQYQILSSIFSHKLSRKLSFLGGTNLRIVHGLKRFSEDIDFDNKGLSYSEFKLLGKELKRDLEKEGFLVEISFVKKFAFHCNIRFPKLLYENGISPIEQEKILIQIDTFDQKVAYLPEIFILNKFEFFDQILVTPKDIILSQKIWTITQRKRLKGRDFYDIMFLLQDTKPNIHFLEAKFFTNDLSKIKKIVIKHLENANFEALSKDVAPFLLNPDEAEKVKNFMPFFIQQFK